MAIPSNNIAFTAPINPPGADPILTRSQIWNGLLFKIRSAETFVPAGIQSTTVLSESVDEAGNPVTLREVVFRADQRRVKETVTAHKDSRVDFVQPDGSTISNIVSEGAAGELYMTYAFEWRHPGASEEELAALREREKMMSKGAVEGTISAMRELVRKGEAHIALNPVPSLDSRYYSLLFSAIIITSYCLSYTSTGLVSLIYISALYQHSH